DRGSYEEKSILIHGQDALNRLIDGRLVRYALQPIVSARDGSIYGYELLMRPEIEQLSNLDKLFRLAKAQSKLHQIERLTWYEALGTFARLKRSNLVPPGTHAFINSIGSQLLDKESVDWLEGAYGDILGRVVVEITEGEEANTLVSTQKRAVVKRWGAKIAIDDFGTGFNSENVLVNFSPDLVKIDISIVRDIDTDPNRLSMVKNMIRYARDRNIMILAEGVETRAELKTLINCGIDYIQGFYVARPALEVPCVCPEIVAEIKEIYEETQTGAICQ
ncbi:MAG: EAL domain-containing protein, partial [Oscillospiraceae bacterium]